MLNLHRGKKSLARTQSSDCSRDDNVAVGGKGNLPR